MPSCEKFEYLLCLRQDGALSASEEGLLQAHLQDCCACSALSDELAQMQAVFPLLQAEMPDTLHAGMLDALQQEPAPLLVFAPKPKRSFYMRRFATTAAAFVLLISGLAFASKFSDAPLGPVPSDTPSVLAAEGDQSPLAIAQTEQEEAAPLAQLSDADKDTAQPPMGKPRHMASEDTDTAKQTGESSESSAPMPFALERSASLPLPQIGTARSPKLDRYEAAEQLLSKLYDEGETSATISLSQIDLEKECFLFSYTDSKGETQSFCVSMQDGSIEGPLMIENAQSPTN